MGNLDGHLMFNPLKVPIRLSADLVVHPRTTAFVPLSLCLTALAMGMRFAEKANGKTEVINV